jgi:hypothetical protein
MRSAVCYLGLLALVLSLPPLSAQEPAADFRTVTSTFSHRVVETNELTIAQMNLGRLALDTNRFTALVTNKMSSPQTLGLNIRAVPGLWVRANWQHGYRFEIPARSQRLIEAAYVFRRAWRRCAEVSRSSRQDRHAGGLRVSAIGSADPAQQIVPIHRHRIGLDAPSHRLSRGRFCYSVSDRALRHRALPRCVRPVAEHDERCGAAP